ncbi:hypothetical protein PtA15_14A134 [Puccinia triticina]|uniref:Uncharacterized protein n=1 Tax=Puccinia triticina TaxID=208348 RepID=A0ABY7D3K3_9BASI|nr:uncharacterized protein PtA15_14A134 [Puccinia triticina]WAQ91252.1 hypothetical protein PtA15_14A134 [Puccinia triticina]
MMDWTLDPSPAIYSEALGLGQENITAKSGHKLSTRNADPDPTPSVPPRMVVKSPSHDDSPPAVPFDSNLFLEHMRCPHAEPIAKYLRLFLKEFTKRTTHPPKTTGVAEQVKVVNNFLDVRLSYI